MGNGPGSNERLDQVANLQHTKTTPPSSLGLVACARAKTGRLTGGEGGGLGLGEGGGGLGLGEGGRGLGGGGRGLGEGGGLRLGGRGEGGRGLGGLGEGARGEGGLRHGQQRRAQPRGCSHRARNATAGHCHTLECSCGSATLWRYITVAVLILPKL